jgi:hypothetical protein
MGRRDCYGMIQKVSIVSNLDSERRELGIDERK